MLSFISFWLFLLTLAYSNSHLLLLFTLSFLFSPALNSSYGFLFLLPSCLLPVAQMVLRDQDVGTLHDAHGIEQLPERVNPRSHCSFQISPLLANSYLWALGSLGNKPSEDGLPCGTILEWGAVQLERAWSSSAQWCHEETETWTKLLNPAPCTSARLTWFSELKCQCCGRSLAVSFPCLLDDDDAPGILKTSPKSGKDHEKHALNCMHFLIFLGSVLKGAFDREKPSSPTLNPLSFLRGETVDSLL